MAHHVRYLTLNSISDSITEKLENIIFSALNLWSYSKPRVQLIVDDTCLMDPGYVLHQSDGEILISVNNIETVLAMIVGNRTLTNGLEKKTMEQILINFLNHIINEIDQFFGNGNRLDGLEFSEQKNNDFNIQAIENSIRFCIETAEGNFNLNLYTNALYPIEQNKITKKNQFNAFDLLGNEKVKIMAFIDDFVVSAADLEKLTTGDVLISNKKLENIFQICIGNKYFLDAEMAEYDGAKAIVIRH